MKLKYYLRGLGLGILFATLVMTVSSVIHNNNLSDETIIKKALALGMIMPEDASSTEDGLWSKKDTENQVVENTETIAEPQSTEESQSTEEASSEEPLSSQEQTVPEEPATIMGDNNVTLIKIQVYPGNAARQVAETLYANGLVEDAESFRIYLGEQGIAQKLAVGTFYIPVGATYEEIGQILVEK